MCGLWKAEVLKLSFCWVKHRQTLNMEALFKLIFSRASHQMRVASASLDPYVRKFPCFYDKVKLKYGS